MRLREISVFLYIFVSHFVSCVAYGSEKNKRENDTDSTENRAYVHIGKKDMDQYCKIWLEPKISVAKKGELTDKQLKQVAAIVEKYHKKLLEQWRIFKKCGKVKMQTINE